MPHKDTWEKTPGGIWSRFGDLQPIGIANPAAGANLSFTLGGGGIYRFVSLKLLFTTSADVASRVMNVTFTHGGLEFFRTGSSPAQVASSSFFYVLYAAPNAFTAINTVNPLPVPIDFFLPGGTVITTSVASIQAADQISAVGLFVEFFPDAGEY